MAFLSEHSDRLVPFKRDDDVMWAGSLDSASAKEFFELLGAGAGVGCVGDLIDPFRWGGLVRFLFADPVPYHRFFNGGSWVPWNTINNEVPIEPIDGVEAHSEGGEAFPIFLFRVSEIANSGAACVREGIPLALTTES